MKFKLVENIDSGLENESAMGVLDEGTITQPQEFILKIEGITREDISQEDMCNIINSIKLSPQIELDAGDYDYKLIIGGPKDFKNILTSILRKKFPNNNIKVIID